MCVSKTNGSSGSCISSATALTGSVIVGSTIFAISSLYRYTMKQFVESISNPDSWNYSTGDTVSERSSVINNFIQKDIAKFNIETLVTEISECLGESIGEEFSSLKTFDQQVRLAENLIYQSALNPELSNSQLVKVSSFFRTITYIHEKTKSPETSEECIMKSLKIREVYYTQLRTETIEKKLSQKAKDYITENLNRPLSECLPKMLDFHKYFQKQLESKYLDLSVLELGEICKKVAVDLDLSINQKYLLYVSFLTIKYINKNFEDSNDLDEKRLIKGLYESFAADPTFRSLFSNIQPEEVRSLQLAIREYSSKAARGLNEDFLKDGDTRTTSITLACTKDFCGNRPLPDGVKELVKYEAAQKELKWFAEEEFKCSIPELLIKVISFISETEKREVDMSRINILEVLETTKTICQKALLEEDSSICQKKIKKKPSQNPQDSAPLFESGNRNTEKASFTKHKDSATTLQNNNISNQAPPKKWVALTRAELTTNGFKYVEGRANKNIAQFKIEDRRIFLKSRIERWEEVNHYQNPEEFFDKIRRFQDSGNISKYANMNDEQLIDQFRRHYIPSISTLLAQDWFIKYYGRKVKSEDGVKKFLFLVESKLGKAKPVTECLSIGIVQGDNPSLFHAFIHPNGEIFDQQSWSFIHHFSVESSSLPQLKNTKIVDRSTDQICIQNKGDGSLPNISVFHFDPYAKMKREIIFKPLEPFC